MMSYADLLEFEYYGYAPGEGSPPLERNDTRRHWICGPEDPDMLAFMIRKEAEYNEQRQWEDRL
jgi:hypothetical protein